MRISFWVAAAAKDATPSVDPGQAVALRLPALQLELQKFRAEWFSLSALSLARETMTRSWTKDTYREQSCGLPEGCRPAQRFPLKITVYYVLLPP